MFETAAVSAVIGLDALAWENDLFQVRSFSSEDRLETSLGRVGMLQPPWLWTREKGRYVILDGFNRLQWASRAGYESVPCRVFPADAGYEQLWLLRVEGKLCGPPLNAAEKAQLIAKAAAALPARYLVERLLPALGLAPRPEVVDQWCRLADAGEALLQAVAMETVCQRAALALSSRDDAERSAMLGLLKELRCSASIQVEILERIAELALRRGQPSLAVVAEPQIQAIFKDRQANRRQKTLMLRELLTRWRFPRLQAREERFAREVKTLALPPRIRLHPPAGFEGEEWRLEITFASPEELLSLLEAMRSCTRSQALAAVLQGGCGAEPAVPSLMPCHGRELQSPG